MKRQYVWILALTLLVLPLNVIPADKLKRGVVNLVTAPVEIPKNVRAYWIEGSEVTSHISFWLFSGLVKGMVDSVARFGSGAWDVLTFPWEDTVDRQPLVQPSYVFDEWPTREENFIERSEVRDE